MEQLHYQGSKTLMWFSGNKRPFLMVDLYCTEADCPCRAVELEFSERNADGSAVADPVRFSVSLELDTWREHDPPKRGGLVRRLVEEFLRDLPDEVKRAFRDAFARTKKTARRLATCEIPVKKVVKGTLVSFAEVFSDDPKDASEHTRFGWSFTCEGRTYYVNDLYCPNPECDCDEAHLAFLEYRREGPHSASLSERFLAQLTLRGKLEIVKTDDCTTQQAKNLAARWRASHANILNEIRWRYHEVKKIGERVLRASDRTGKPSPARRSLDLRGAPLSSPFFRSEGSTIRGTSKIGPNAPCPCGSGEKYKKCCGRRSS